MTETLKQLMDHDAHTADFAPLDLDALVAAGHQRVRRRRLALASTGVAAAAAVALAVPLALSGGTSDHAGPAPAVPSSDSSVSWATDSVIHDGDRSIDTGHHVDAYVRTTDGFVLASDGRVFSVVGSDVEPVGQVVHPAQPRLVVDGSRVGWQSPDGFSVYDQSTDRESGFQGAAGPRSTFYALDGTTAYWRDGTGDVVAFDVKTKQKQVVAADPRGAFDLLDAQNGVLATRTDDGTRLGPDPQHGVDLQGVYGELGDFSPSATYWATDADDPQVYEVATGERVDIRLPGYVFAAAYGWLDDGHVLMIASKDQKGPAQLVTCTVPAGQCTPSTGPLGDFADLVGHFALPTGTAITG